MSALVEHLQALDAISDAMAEATSKADWERLQKLDTAVREHVGILGDAAKAGELPVADVVKRLDRLQVLFGAARAEAVKSRDEAGAALKSSGRTHQAAQAYLKTVQK